MAETKIEWADFTFNPWVGCSKVSPACTHCYAEAWAKRSGMVKWGNDAERRRTSEANWREPLKWNRKAMCLHCGYAEWDGSDDCRKCSNEFNKRRRPRVFCASLADVFEDRKELAPWRDDLFQLIDRTPNLDWLILTKRPENIQRLWPFGWYDDQFSWPNVWIGTTVENQEYADKRIPELLKIPARVRFLSVEPLLGPVYFTNQPYWDWRYSYDFYPKGMFCRPIDWVIVGGESGPNARPTHPEWFRSLRNQCQAAGVPFFLKQWGEFVEVDADRPTQQVDWDDMCLYPVTDKSVLIARDGEVITRRGQPREEVAYRWMERVGKKAAGRLLDGVEHSAFPEVA